MSAYRPGIIGLLAVLMLLLLQACSTLTLGYNRAATLTYWWLDSQLDLTETQSQQLRTDLDELHRWHRRDALPRYTQLLTGWERLAGQNVTASQACEQFESARALLLQIAERSTQPLVQLGLSVSPAQREHLSRQHAKDNRRFREDFVLPPGFGLDKRAQRLTDRLEMFYGRLTPDQQHLVRDHLARGSFDGTLALAERERRQADVLRAIIDMQAAPAQSAQLVRAVVQRAIDSPSPQYREAARQWQQQGCALMAALHNSTTPLQRQKLLESLRAYSGDLTLLAQQN